MALVSAVLAALSSSTKMAEVAVLVIVVALLLGLLVLYRRQNKAPTKSRHSASHSNDASSYYGNLNTLVGASSGTGIGSSSLGQPDPFAMFGPPAAPPQQPPSPPVAPTPPPGPPPGWLPDPSGAPDTLRYWDGTRWTEHVAQRS